MKKALKNIDLESTNRIIEMAWEDRTPFDAISKQFDISEKEIISVMRNNIKKKSFLNWRKRVDNRKTKHTMLSSLHKKRFKSNAQRQISFNRSK